MGVKGEVVGEPFRDQYRIQHRALYNTVVSTYLLTYYTHAAQRNEYRPRYVGVSPLDLHTDTIREKLELNTISHVYISEAMRSNQSLVVACTEN